MRQNQNVRGGIALQAGGNIKITAGMTHAQIVDVASLVVDKLRISLGSGTLAAEILHKTVDELRNARNAAAAEADRAFRNMIKSWCDSRLRGGNVRSFFECVSALHNEI